MAEDLEDINRKLDILMKHVGCEMTEKKYMDMSDEEKDDYDEKHPKKEKEEPEE